MNNPNATNTLEVSEYHAYGPVVAKTEREVVLLKRCVALERALTPIVKSYTPLPQAEGEPLQYAVPAHKIQGAADVLDFGWWMQEP